MGNDNANKKKKICILGSTGSIGVQALQVIEEHADMLEAYVLTANSQADLLIEQARRFQPAAVVIADESKYEYVREALADEPIQVYAGADALCQVVQMEPVGVVLTIPAAGSEGSGNSVITKLDGLHKISLRTDTALRPRFAVMNPELTFTLPPYQTASGIADMMTHIYERYFTNTPDVEVTDRVAEGVLKAIINEAPKVMADPVNYEARANIMWCGTLAHNGVCGTGRQEDWVSHFMEHELSAVYGVTHGAGLAVIVPAWLTFMVDHNPGKVQEDEASHSVLRYKVVRCSHREQHPRNPESTHPCEANRQSNVPSMHNPHRG